MADRAGVEGTVTPPYDPGRDAAERYPDWVIRHRPLGGVIPEVLCQRRKVILIDLGANWFAKRCSLAHAVAHLDLEHPAAVNGSSTFERWMEKEANGLAARRLIPIRSLAEVLKWTRERHEIAHELQVDLATLETRRAHLHETERGLLRRSITWLEETG